MPNSAKIVLGALAFFLHLSSLTLAATDNSDPNAAVRKSIPPQSSALKAVTDVQALQRRNNEVAMNHFTRLIAKDPKDAASYLGRGKAYSGLKDYKKALVDLDKAIELDPQEIEGYRARAVVKLAKKDYDGSWKDVHTVESLGGVMWPSFSEALKESSGRTS